MYIPDFFQVIRDIIREKQSGHVIMVTETSALTTSYYLLVRPPYDL